MTSIGSLSFFVKTPNERLPIALQSGRTTCQRRFGSAYGFGVSCRENDVDRNVRSWIWKKMVVEGGCSVRFGSSSRVVSVMAVGKRGVSETEVDGADNDGDDFGVDVDDDLIKTTVEKSEKVQSLQNGLLQQIAERRKLISSIKESILDTATDAVASGGDNSFLSDYGIALINENSDKENKNKKSKNYSTTVTTEKPETTNDMNGSLIGVEKEFLDDTKIENLVANALGLSREKDFVETDAVTIPSLLPNFAEIDAAKDVKHEEPEEENKVLTVEEEADSEKGKTNTPLAGLNVMNVILVAAECAPWSKTGGLGDVAGALPKALARRGHRVMVVVPQYRNYSETQETGVRKIYNVDGQDMEVTYHHALIDGVDFVFMDSAVFRGLHDIYGGQRMDIFKRMALLCKAAVEVPWLVPCGGTCYGDGNLVFIANDWHTALLPVYLKAYYRDNGLMKFARSVLVIHNIAYQGRGPLDDFKYLALPPHHFDLFKFYDPVGGEHLNIFAAGIKAADRVVAVSHGYSWELKTLEGGWGLHHIINDNDWKLHGIVNGIDTEDWNPEVDVHLKSDGYTNYSLKTLKTGKAQCKAALQREFSLPVRDVPLAGFIGRLDGQKGVDIIAEAIPWLVSQDAQLILLGTGRNDLEDLLRKFEGLYHDKVIGRVGFSVRWAHRITAGADILLMPSRFEPCGLNQLYAMSYGTVPVVHAVGGLRDTVKPFNPFTNEGVGWTFDRADANALIDAMKNCFDTYWNYKSSWEDLQVRGMTQDLGWDNVAERYEEVLVAAKYQW